MSCDNKELILEYLLEEELEFCKEEGYIGNTAQTLAEANAIDRFERGDYWQGDYELD